MSELPLPYSQCSAGRLDDEARSVNGGVQGYLAHEKTPLPLGSPQVPRHKANVGSYGGSGSYEQGIPEELDPGDVEEGAARERACTVLRSCTSLSNLK